MGDDQVLRDLEAVLAAEREGEIAGAPAVALPALGGVQLPQTHPWGTTLLQQPAPAQGVMPDAFTQAVIQAEVARRVAQAQAHMDQVARWAAEQQAAQFAQQLQADRQRQAAQRLQQWEAEQWEAQRLASQRQNMPHVPTSQASSGSSSPSHYCSDTSTARWSGGGGGSSGEMLGPPSPDGVQRRRRRNPSGDATNNVIIPALLRAGAERRTTLMLKNVGYALTQEGLLATIERRHRGAFDYLYLPMDFERGQNRGFAFVNFITPRGVPNFYEEFHGHPLTESSANRRVEIIFADVQGKEENLRESARYRPACFVSDGSHRREM